jgi:5-methylcytosine-specific restriction enzyme subunit McrC
LWLRVAEFDNVPVPFDLVTKDGRFDFYREAIDSGLFAARFSKDQLVIQPQAFVGWIALNDRFGVEVAPRVPIADLDRLLAIAGAVPREFRAFTRRYGTSPHERPSFREAVGRALVAALEPIERYGLLHRYERQQIQTSHPKGRVLAFETARKHWAQGRRDRAAVIWYERSENVGPNQVLRVAVRLMARALDRETTRPARAIVRALNRSDRLLGRVVPSLAGLSDSDVRDPSRLPPIRSYYRPALELARTIVRARTVSLSDPGDELGLPSLLFKLDEAFEEYLRQVLTYGLRDLAPLCSVLPGRTAPPAGAEKSLFDEGGRPKANPDVVVVRGPADDRGEALVAIEVKYIDRSFGRGELEQAIGYSASYRCPTVLVRPRARGEREMGLEHVGRIDSVEIKSYVFDLGAVDLYAEERRWIAAIRDAAVSRL